MRILVWHLHGGWMDSFLLGGHHYLLPTTHGRRLDRPRPDVEEIEPALLRDAAVDAVVLQRPEEIAWTARLLGRTPGRDLPAVYVEHNTPKMLPVTERHPLADQQVIPIVHVTRFNRLVWDCGDALTRVIDHGVPDRGALYTGRTAALAVVVNEPVRRGRITGTDLLPRFSSAARLDCFGIGTEDLPGTLGLGPDRLTAAGDVPTSELHRSIAERRAYLHPFRWTSLGLSLLEAMSLGMPVLALAATEAVRAVPATAGTVSADPEELAAAARTLLADPEQARERGRAARAHALSAYGIERFRSAWDRVLHEAVDDWRAAHRWRTAAFPDPGRLKGACT